MKQEGKGLVVKMLLDTPKEEGHYFVQYHRNFEPVMCYVEAKDDGKLWLNTKTTSKPLDGIKAFCFSERL